MQLRAIVNTPSVFWTQDEAALCASLACGVGGLDSIEAERRIAQFGPNSDVTGKRVGVLSAALRRLLEPLCLILLVAAGVSIATGDEAGGTIIVAILVFSIGLDTFQEGRAAKAAELLRQSVALKAEVKRDGIFRTVPVESVVPGDIVRVRAGDIVPADGRILQAIGFTANEAALTGEPYPVEKRPGAVDSHNAADASNALFRGAVAQTGEATALVVATGRSTLFGTAAFALAEAEQASSFQRDLHAFGLMVARLIIALIVLILAAHVLFGRPVLQSLMFAVALAVGLTPELLPMITTVTLSRGALRMAQRKVIVKRLTSIHDLGAMTVLCTDKTGTLTSARITLAQSLDGAGNPDTRPVRLGGISAVLAGDRGALDAALIAACGDVAGWTLIGRQPFDFNRRVGAVVADGPEGRVLICKGAPESVLALCNSTRASGRVSTLGATERAAALARVQMLADQGLRAVAVATRPWNGQPHDPQPADEAELVYQGLCVFSDPPKATSAAAIARLAACGVQVKILSGDDPVVVKRLAGQVGLNVPTVLMGAEVGRLDDQALALRARTVHAFGRLTPDQKARLVRALRTSGDIVGYLGDGINDAPALKAADVGLSVEGATGVAQAAADMILLAPDLEVVADGVEEGRRTFVNILKYVRMGASSNFGNMLSMAAASLFLPFLPMLPIQILLNNLIYDVSEIGIPFDTVRREAIAEPQIWDGAALLRFTLVMGPLSSAFDLLTFAALRLIFDADPDTFRTAWFVESMATQILVIFLIRTNGWPWNNRPHPLLTVSSLGALTVAMILPFSTPGAWFGFAPLSLPLAACIGLLVAIYLAAAEVLKRLAVRPRPPGRFGA
ncbi:magnesium-translocating P-type ATPase [Enhydrobacter sp.]|jgi:Mg2+-importing ATPase|uniref:magnesium-translocating P-type ATPase n=1 Tax=Enhydrobacter sp. TaxID=1894999 RepID=UPI00263961BE|nr:magnesium-translocating P-type ATPase [Enhydrobacter sp.]WIM11934.1 MAG: Mg(2+) transport ATPase, P-type [Enhydrobacter sp.]